MKGYWTINGLNCTAKATGKAVSATKWKKKAGFILTICCLTTPSMKHCIKRQGVEYTSHNQNENLK